MGRWEPLTLIYGVILIMRGKITRQCLQTTNFEQKGDPEQGIEPTSSAYQAQ